MNMGHQSAETFSRQWLSIALSGAMGGAGMVVSGAIAPSWAAPSDSAITGPSTAALSSPEPFQRDISTTTLGETHEVFDSATVNPSTVNLSTVNPSEAIAPLTPAATPMRLAESRMSEFRRDIVDVVVPPSNGERIADIEVRFVNDGEPDDGRTRDVVILREFELEPGDTYDATLAAEGLQRLNNLDIIREATVSLEPTGTDNDVVMVVTVDERTPFPVEFDLSQSHPTALIGPSEPDTVLPGTIRSGGLSGGLQVRLTNPFGINQTFAGGIEAGENVGNFAISYTNPQINSGSTPIGLALNVFNSREVQNVFDGGEDEVQLANDRDPWVHRFGGGVELFHSFTPNLAIASGFSYQKVSIRDDVFTDDIFQEDELGNELTFSGDGQDDLLMWSLSASWDQRDDRRYPTTGHRFLFRSDQYIPVGDANVAGNRLAANFTQYVPLPLFGFDDGPQTLVLNVQGGTFIGELPPYEAFSLGGGGSVRGFDGGDVGTGRSFIQATAEYRFPIFDFVAFNDDIDVGGTLFVDYANDLGSGDTVLGEPAEVRNKPGDGLGYGLGLRVRTPVGPLRLEFGIADTGETNFLVNIGDRF